MARPVEPDVADGLSLLDPCARADAAGEAAQMAVAGGDAVEVPELDQVAVAAGPSGPEHDAVARGHDRRAGRGGVVGALVPPGDARGSGWNRARAKLEEIRRNSHRGAEERAPQRVARRRRRSARVPAGVEAERGQALAGHREIARQHPAEADLAVLRDQPLEHAPGTGRPAGCRG